MKQNEELTEDQLWELCLLEEKKKRIAEQPKSGNDKAIDWDYQRFIYERSLDLK